MELFFKLLVDGIMVLVKNVGEINVSKCNILFKKKNLC